MSSVPLKFLMENCVNCADLLRVQVIAQGVTISRTVSYVKNSQYWFIIEFNYADLGIVPVFQYTVQINPIYAEYFRLQDLLQKISQIIDPINLPQPGGIPISNEMPQLPSGGFQISGLRREPDSTEVIDESGSSVSLPVNENLLFP